MSAPDPWAIQRWAYQTPTGSPVRKALLMVLAVMADKTTGRCEALQATLMQWTEVNSDRTIREHLTALEEQRTIARRHQYLGSGRRACDEYLLLAPWVKAWPDGQPLPADIAGSTTGNSQQSLPADDAVTTGAQQPVKRTLPLKNDRIGTSLSPTLSRQAGKGEDQQAGSPRRRGRRSAGTNPRALGANPRAQQEAPRDTGTNPRQLTEAARLWEQVVDDIAERIGNDPAPISNLRLLTPVAHRDDGTILIGGSGASFAGQRYGRLVDASAAQLGVVIEFPTTQPGTATDRRRRPRRKAA